MQLSRATGAVVQGCAGYYCWIVLSLIAGAGYRVEQWGGKWDGTMGVANRVTGTAVQGCAGYYVSKALTSSQRPYEQVQCCHLFQHHGEMVRTWGHWRLGRY